MPSAEVRVLLFLLVFVALNAVLLRLSCRLANFAGRWTPHWVLLKVPRYRTCLVIVFGVLVIAGLVGSAAELFIGSWAADLFQNRAWTIAVYVAEILLIIKLLSWGITDEQPGPTRLATIASLVHVLLFFAVCFTAGQVLPGLVLHR